MHAVAAVELLLRWREGDQRSADELVRRYTDRLVALARKRLPHELASRVDAEDVVQSAYRSFFRVDRDGRHVVVPGDDIWQCLATIIVRKVQKRIRHHKAGKRSVDRERVGDGGGGSDYSIELMDREPSAEEQVALIEELERGMRMLALPLHRQMVAMILQGHPVDQVAAATHRTERMVSMVWKSFRDLVEARLEELAGE